MNELEVLVSVGMPVYNAQDFLQRSLESVYEQTYKNLEIVIVDDGSSDNSKEIIKSISEKYPQRLTKMIFLPHNTGTWNARNLILDNMHGEYLAFCDADDWIERDFIEKMVRQAVETDSRVVICQYRDSDDRIVGKKIQTRLDEMPINTLQFSLVNKLIKHSIIDRYNLRVFSGVNCWDDLSITSRVFAKAHGRVSVLNEPLYHYESKRPNSLSKSSSSKILHERVVCAYNLLGWFAVNTREHHNRQFLLNMCFFAKVKYITGAKKHLGKWRRTFPRVNHNIWSINIPLLYRFVFFCLAKLPYKYMRKILKILERKDE